MGELALHRGLDWVWWQRIAHRTRDLGLYAGVLTAMAAIPGGSHHAGSAAVAGLTLAVLADLTIRACVCRQARTLRGGLDA